MSVKGINVLGHLRSSAGLGHTARLFIDVLRSNGYEVAGLDIDASFGAEVSPGLQEEAFFESVEQLPFDHNLMIANITRLPQFWLRHLAGMSSPRFRNAGMLFWELPVIPPAWIPSLRMFDVMLTPSQFIRQTFETFVPEVPTVYAEHPLPRSDPAQDRDASRARFGIPADSTAFCCSFDPRSGLARKNPLGALTAWTRAFPSDPNVCLVVKSNGDIGDVRHTESPEEVRSVIAAVQRDPRIHLIAQRMPHDEVMRLYGCCDIQISLHRSEGLGLGPMEAMSLGKLVIATGYSGNMTFMTEQNSLPIPYRLVQPGPDVPNFNRRFAGPGALWAEPDLEQAASLLRSAAENPQLRRQLGGRARRDIQERQEAAWEGRFIEPMFRLLEASDRMSLRRSLKHEIALREVLDPTLFKKNIKAVFRR